MNISIQDSSSFQQLSGRYQAMTKRDRLALKLLLAFICTVVIIFGILVPVSDYKSTAETRYKNSLETLTWMQANQSSVATVNQQRSEQDAGQSLLGIANKTSKGFGLSFKRYQPVGDSGLSLWLENSAFNQLVLWLERLEKRHGIRVDEISVERAAQDGVVNVRLVLQG